MVKNQGGVETFLTTTELAVSNWTLFCTLCICYFQEVSRRSEAYESVSEIEEQVIPSQIPLIPILNSKVKK